MSKPKIVAPAVPVAPTEAELKAQKVKELEMAVLRRKARIFDIIEEKSKIRQQATLLGQKADSMEQEIQKEQNTLNGDRKVLQGLIDSKV